MYTISKCQVSTCYSDGDMSTHAHIANMSENVCMKELLKSKNQANRMKMDCL